MLTTGFAHRMGVPFLLVAVLGLGACSESGCADCGPFATQWREVDEPLPTPRRALSGSVVGEDARAEELYVIGGETLSQSPLSTVEILDVETETWRSTTPLSVARAGLTSAVVNGQIYAIGGRDQAGPVGTVEVYDPTTEVWITRASLPTPRAALGSASVGDSIYVIGGTTGDGLPSALVEVYDTTTDTWQAANDMPTARSGAIVVGVGFDIFVIGGWNGAYLATTEKYNTMTGTWETLTPIPVPPGEGVFGAELFGSIFVMGGYDLSGDITALVQRYDVYTDRWSNGPSMNPARANATAAGVNRGIFGWIYVVGGDDETTLLERAAALF